MTQDAAYVRRAKKQKASDLSRCEACTVQQAGRNLGLAGSLRGIVTHAAHANDSAATLLLTPNSCLQREAVQAQNDRQRL